MKFLLTIIKKPVTMIMLALLIIGFGIMSALNMPLALFPDMKMPVLAVTTFFPGADAETIEENVTSKIERTLRTISEIDTITTNSYDNMSIIILTFSFDEDVVVKENEAKSKLEQLTFPSGVEKPMTSKVDMNQMPVATVSLTSDTKSFAQLSTYAKEIKIKLEAIKGVAEVSLKGEVTPKIKIKMKDKEEMNLLFVYKALMEQSTEIPLGTIEQGKDTISIKNLSKLKSLEALRNMELDIVNSLGKTETVILSDIADVFETEKFEKGTSFLNGKQAISFDVLNLSTANISGVVSGVQNVILEMESGDYDLVLIEDQSQLISESLSTVWSSLIIGGILAIIIIVLFLRNFRSSIIIAISMPLSVLATIITLYALNVSMNIVSLGGIAVGIGMLVDNSIVVIESISRQKDLGMTSKKAAYLGTKSVILPISASTLTTVAVFLPIMFVTGMTKMIFRDMSLAVIFSLVYSLIMSITVIPSMYAFIGKQTKREKQKSLNVKAGLTKIENGYKKLLSGAVRFRFLVSFLAIILLVGSAMLMLGTGMDFLPKIDKGVMRVTVESDEKTLEDATKEVENYLKSEISNTILFSSSVGNNGLFGSDDTAIISVKLDETKVPTQDVVKKLRNAEFSSGISLIVEEIDGIVSTFIPNSNGIDLSILGEETMVLQEISKKLETSLKSISNLGTIRTSIEESTFEYQIIFDETNEDVKRMGMENLLQVLRVGLSSQDVLDLKTEGKTQTINISFNANNFDTIEKVENLYLIPPSSYKPYGITLGDVAEITQDERPSMITKLDGKNVLTISCELVSGDVGTTSKIMEEKILNVLKDYDGYNYESQGVQSYLFEAFEGLVIALIVSFFLVFAIMASQFESFKKPFIVLFSIPFSFVGAFLAILITGTTLNVVSFVGVIMLMGVIVNNAIVMIDKVAENLKEGMTHYDALIEGVATRLRPILMTVLTTVLALLPLALGIGKGSELMQPMGIVVIGGMTLGTLVTLIFIPVVYSIFMRVKKPVEVKQNKVKSNKIK